MAKRTAIMHDDIGIITGPDGSGKRIETVTELATLINNYGGPVAVVINSDLTHSGGVIEISSNSWLIFTASGRFTATSGSININGCVLAPGHIKIFNENNGTVIVKNGDCFQSKAWWGLPGAWFVDTLHGSLDILGDLTAEGLLVESGFIGDCEILTVCGGTMTGPLYLSRDPQGAMEAVTRQWVVDLIGGNGELQIDNFRKLVFKNECDSSTVEYAADGPVDELQITIDAALNMKAIYTELEPLYDYDDSVPTTPSDEATWWSDAITAAQPDDGSLGAWVDGVSAETYPVLDGIGDPGISLVPCT